MDGNFGWIEIVFFYGIALGFALWQYFKMDRDLKQIRREKAEKAEREASESAEETGSEPPEETPDADGP